MAQIPKGRLVRGPYKPICRDCAIYFSINVIFQSVLGHQFQLISVFFKTLSTKLWLHIAYPSCLFWGLQVTTLPQVKHISSDQSPGYLLYGGGLYNPVIWGL